MKHALILFLVSINYLLAQSDALRFEHYGQDKGLSQGTGYAIAQYDNYLWFGTQDGLNKFDGYTIEVIRTGNHLLNNNLVATLLADSEGRFWIGTGSGVNLYDKKTNQILQFTEVFGIKHPINDKLSIKKIVEDKQNNIWIIAEPFGIYKFNPSTKTIKEFLPNIPNLTDCVFDKAGKLWVSSLTSLYTYETSKDSFEIVPKEKFKLASNATIYALLVDNSNQLWIGTFTQGVYVLDANTFYLRHHYTTNEGLLSNNIRCMLQGNTGNIWLGTSKGGLSRFDAKTETFTHNKFNPTNPKTISDDTIWSLFEDQQNILWVGTSSKGIDKYDPIKFQFFTIQKEYDNPKKSISDNMIYKILGQNDKLYIGTSTEVGKYNLKTKTNEPIFSKNEQHPDDSYTNEVRTMSEDEKHNIWMMNWRGIVQYDSKTQKSKTYPLKQELAIFLYSTQFVQEKQEVWVGGNNGFSIFDLKNKTWKESYGKLALLSKKVVRLMYKDSQQKRWVGTLGDGLYRYDGTKEEILHFTANELCPNIRSMLEIDNILWVGSDCGLYKINLKTLKIEKKYNETTGLLNNVIYSILPENQEFLWLSSNKGLAKFSIPKGQVIKNYDENDGLQSNEFNTNCSYKHPDGTLFFGGVNGITYFKPETIKENNFISPIKITKIKVLDSLYNPNAEIVLKPNQNVINVEFVAFNFSNTEKNTYEYILEGVDKKWIKAGNVNQAKYTNLSTGEYIFRVKGKNNDAIKSSNEAFIKIIILPYYYQTWWFLGALLGLLAMGLYYLYRSKLTTQILKTNVVRDEAIIRRQEAELKEKEALFQQKIAEVEMSALRSQMNPHFIFNCLNSIKSYALNNDSDNVSLYLTKFSKLIRLVLENSKSEKILLKNELLTLQLYMEMEQLRFGDKFEFELRIAHNVEEEFIQISPMLIQPYLENAIWHGLMHKEEKGKVLLKVTQPSERQLQIIIQDDGIGRAKSVALKSKTAITQKSFGMKITSQRLEIIKQLYKIDAKITIEDLENPTGTKVVIDIPF